MNFHSQEITKSLLLVLALFLSLTFVIRNIRSENIAQERELEDQIPKHLPIKIKIKSEKEKAFKDLNNAHWLRDFELEVQNTGDKPIYYLALVLTITDIRAPNGNEYGFPLHFGTAWDFTVLPKPEDIYLKPKETYVFKIPARWIKGWEMDKGHPQPKKVRVIFQKLNFGDGTGFFDSGGTPFLSR